MPTGTNVVNGGQVCGASTHLKYLSHKLLQHFNISVSKHFNVTIFVALTLLLLQVIIERAGRNDGGTYECWDTAGEAASISKQVQWGNKRKLIIIYILLFIFYILHNSKI